MKILGILLNNNKFILGLTLLLATLAIVAVLRFKLNLGSDYQEKPVMQVKFSEQLTSDQLANALNSLDLTKPERIDQQGNNIFTVYYQNLNDRDKENLVKWSKGCETQYRLYYQALV